jgi:hypothetical protein
MTAPDPREEENLGAENEQDELDIIGNQDETDPGDINRDDPLMGAGPTDNLGPAEEPGDFMRGEVDVKEQMDRVSRGVPNPRETTP